MILQYSHRTFLKKFNVFTSHKAGHAIFESLIHEKGLISTCCPPFRNGTGAARSLWLSPKRFAHEQVALMFDP
jgi:hypothetical protein